MESTIPPFIDHLQFGKRYSAHTIRAYRDDLEAFALYLRDSFGRLGPEEVSPAMIRSWLASLKDAGLSSRSVNRKISSLRSYYKYQLKTAAVADSPLRAIIAPKTSKRLPAFVEQGDMAQLFAEVQFPDDWQGLTDRLILAVLYQTGMRLSELVGLRERQADSATSTVKVLGKGNKERVIPVSGALMTMVEEYKRSKRVELETPDTEFLLVSPKGKKLYPKYVYRAVREYLLQVTTIDQKSPHVLRHTFATHLMNAGAQLNTVKELLGHASLAATQVYTHNTIEKLKDVYKNAHPKA
ncbi:MAG TPA: tyrosine-type recombinase/integrase [Puia sp.]|nr:tyrosine-type recombinase/integrase [Puia sp.]